MDDVAIHARGITKSYRTGSTVTEVLRGIDLSIPVGECLFFVGPSGSGKTTLLSILGCVLSADGGEMRLLGQDVTSLNENQQARFRRRHIGFVFQRFHLFRGLKAWENVRVALDLQGMAPRAARQESFRLLELTGLADKAHSSITHLSMGQRQRVALARALAGDPDLILADEPTASLDAEAGMSAISTLRELTKAAGKTVVVVTHDSRIFPMADRILHLIDGRLDRADRGTPEMNSGTTENTARPRGRVLHHAAK